MNSSIGFPIHLNENELKECIKFVRKSPLKLKISRNELMMHFYAWYRFKLNKTKDIKDFDDFVTLLYDKYHHEDAKSVTVHYFPFIGKGVKKKDKLIAFVSSYIYHHKERAKELFYKERITNEDIDLFFDNTLVNHEILRSKVKIEPSKEKDIEDCNQTAPYFDMGLISSIHKLCNDKQFKTIFELDLYAIFNLQTTSTVLDIKSGEKIRICYLIYKLYKYLDKHDNKAHWRSEILERLKISKKYYDSKYKNPESDAPSKKSGEFAKNVSEIFS